MEITNTGAISSYEIKESIIKSKKRFSYDQVKTIIETGEGDHCNLILALHRIAEILRKRRFRSGGIDFDTFEVKFKLDKDARPDEAIQKRSDIATQLVEECMLAANRTVAGHIRKLSRDNRLAVPLPFVYRIHEEPNPKVLTDTLRFISSLGHKTNKSTSSSKDINKLLESIKSLPERQIASQVLIRSMPKAIYSTENAGHYGLGFKEYTHFTSPIRRYPDLIVHRLLKEYASAKPDKERLKYLALLLKEVSKHSTDRERLAMEAERASIKLAHAMMAQNMLGRHFDGTITGVASYGLYAMLDDFYGEGLLHIRDLYDDYYIFDEGNWRLFGRRHGRIFAFGQRIKVQIIHVNVKKRTIDLRFVDEQ